MIRSMPRGAIYFIVIILAVLEHGALAQTQTRSTSTTGRISNMRFIGMTSKNDVVFMKLVPSDSSIGPQKMSFYYRWANSSDSDVPYKNAFIQTFIATSMINFVKLEHVHDLPFVCIRISYQSQEDVCYSVTDENSPLNLSPPTNARMISTNFNYSLSWDYEHPFLSKEISFVVDICSDFNEYCEEAIYCNQIHQHHCDLFLNDYDADSHMCPEAFMVGPISPRVKPCVTARPDACGEYVTAKQFDVAIENQITPPDFKILGLFNDDQLRIENHPHRVAYSNKLLSCYYDGPLEYNIRFYGANDSFKSYQEFRGFGFSMTSITLKIEHIPVNNTLICVKIEIKSIFDRNIRSAWKTQCQRVYTNLIKENLMEKDVSAFYAVFLSCALVVLILIIFVTYKARRLYKSMYDIEIPNELEEIKQEIENDTNPISMNIVAVKQFESNNYQASPKEIADPLPSFKLVNDVFDCQAVEDTKPDEGTALYFIEDEIENRENSEICHASSETDSLSYVLQTQNGELIFRDSSHSSDPSNNGAPSSPLSSTSSRNSTDDNKSMCRSLEMRSFANATNNVNLNSAVTINANPTSTAVQADQTANIQKRLVCFSSLIPRVDTFQESHSAGLVSIEDASSHILFEEGNLKTITKLENPTYSIPSEPNGFDISETATVIHSKSNGSGSMPASVNAFLKETKTRPISVNSCSSFEGSSVFSMQSTPTQLKTDLCLRSNPASLSHQHKTPCTSSQRCLCHNQCVLTNKRDPGSFSLAPFHINVDQQPTESSHVHFGDVSDQDTEKPLNSSLGPSYVTYERSRADSCRSGDSGLPYDWTFSDDSPSPPQSPDDYLIPILNPQSRKPSVFDHRKVSCRSRCVDETKSRVKITKQQESNTRFSYELQPILSETEEAVPDVGNKFYDLGKSEDDYVTDPNRSVNSDYLKISVLSLKKPQKQQTSNL